MKRWEYKWLGSYWEETGRSEDYLTRVTYDHFWEPDGKTERPFPDDEGLNKLGEEGWELVAMTRGTSSRVTTISPQGNDGYYAFPVYKLVFKRPIQPG